ncbi:related to GYP1-cis-golgi GTPase-activating protein [Sporisorium scitamineum]|uniref:Related to GYP1-cis-golgi GTPase-activating protein n=2 Tax=Sporisorium scitamineum TaxID=49012 RepID=A0A127ZDQ9_9BASI|nr:related to GYP1-cis-golgi GTPase-activating protein [Sporisorium scitamineum]
MSSATVEEFIELLNAEQHVDLQKLRDLARHGVQPSVRGEVWLYLLGVLSDDKGQEMTSVRSKYLAYEALDKHNPALEKRVRSECQRYYQKRLGTRPPPGRTLMRSSRSVLSRKPGGYSAAIGGNGTGGLSLGRDFSLDGASSQSSSLPGSSTGDGTHFAISGSNASALATTTLNGCDRGPNRVNDGRIHALGGIIGESGVSAAMDADDPDAAAALELKRFGRSVENIICAFMNRCAAAETARRQASQSASDAAASALGSQRSSEAASNGISSVMSSDQRHAEGARGRLQSAKDNEEALFRSSKSAEGSGNGNGLFNDVDAAGSTSARHGHSSGTSSRSRSRAGSLGSTSNGHPGGSTNLPPLRSAVSVEESVRSRMPREYEWQPQVDHSTSGTWGTAAEFHPALVYLCAPFVQCVRVEAGMYFAFEKLMTLMARHSSRNPLARQVATFLTLFRTTLPELHSYFEEEEVDIIGFATNWLQHLLAGELRIEDLMRLWDTYFALPDFLDLHLYVCIAILTNCKDSLEELDRSETRSMLDSLPPLDVDRVINEAINIRLSHQRSQRTDD